MPTFIDQPAVVNAAGKPPKQIEEFIGRVNSRTNVLSIARMRSPEGWTEPAQVPEFDEYTVVLRGALRVTTDQGTRYVDAGQAVIVGKGEKVQYSTPLAGGAEYIAVCLPAFAPELVHREAEER
jgi:mannose-6-phosphate isomerase-like protein (cupin superfamily)